MMMIEAYMCVSVFLTGTGQVRGCNMEHSRITLQLSVKTEAT